MNKAGYILLRHLTKSHFNRVLVIAAHPDDEIVGAGITMASLPCVSIVHVTDGVPNDSNYASWAGFATREDYAKARKQEVIKAHEMIGIPDQCLLSLGFLDQQLSRELVPLTRALLDLIVDKCPDIIITHAYEGGHPDHDAVCFASQNALKLMERGKRPLPKLMEMTGYFSRYRQRVVNDFVRAEHTVLTLALSPEESSLKRKLYDCFDSQRVLLNTFPVEYERFRVAPLYDFRKMPDAPEILYEQYGLNTSAEEWIQLTGKALEDLNSHQLIHHNWKANSPTIGEVDFGDLARIEPISRCFGYDRGTPIDRPFIESFLDQHRLDIRGRVLEIGDNTYTKQYGDSRVYCSDVLHVNQGHPGATIIGDLSHAPHIADNSFDCLILTQVLVVIFDLQSTIRTLHRILKPGGVALITVPGISNIDTGEWRDQWMWSFTPNALRELLCLCFLRSNVEVSSRGNVFTSISFLQGLCSEDISHYPIHVDDPSYPQTVMGRAIKESCQSTPITN
jgi:LmbE family N-acetylglucosaminyl deacetylase